MRLRWSHLQSVPLSSYLCSRDFGSHPAGTNEVGNLKHSNKGGVLRFWRALRLLYLSTAAPGGRSYSVAVQWKMTLFHRSEAEIAGACVHRRAALLPATSLTQCHHPHRRNRHDPVPQSSLLTVWGFEVETTNATRLGIKSQSNSGDKVPAFGFD